MQQSSSKDSTSQQNNTLLMQALTSVKEYGIFTLSPEGVVLYWNQGAHAIQGYHADEVLNKPFAELYEKEVGKPAGYFNELIIKANALGQVEEEGWRQHKNGHYYWSTILITPIYDSNKTLIAYTLISRDLTEKKLAAELSEICVASHDTPVCSTSNIIWMRAQDGQFISPHLQWEHFTGQVWPEYQGFGWLKMHPPEEQEKIKAFWQKLNSLDMGFLKENRQALQQAIISNDLLLKTRLWSKIHQEYHYIITAVVPHFKNKDIVAWIGSEKDIHKMTLTELELQSASKEQQLLIKSARIGLWRWDFSTKLCKLDNNVAVLLGIAKDRSTYHYDELIACIAPEDRAKLEAALQHSMQTKELFDEEFRVIWPDNSIHYISTRGEIQTIEEPQHLELWGSSWDITERKQLEIERMKVMQQDRGYAQQRAQQAESYRQKLEEFIDNICHEIRNPLNGIYGSADLMRDKLQLLTTLWQTESEKFSSATAEKLHSTLAQLKDLLKTLDQCADQQKVIVNDVLDYSKLENNKFELNPAPLQLKKVIKAATKIFTAQLAQKNLELSVELPEQDIWLNADANRLSQVIINLISNAIKFTQAGKITITAIVELLSTTHSRLSVKVKDTGVGMTEEEKSRLFERFSQGSCRIAAQHDGSGLGLAISKKLVECMGGTIQVQSQKWHGTEFSFEIVSKNLTEEQKAQLNIVPAKKRALAATFAPTAQNKMILIVEDNVINQRILANYLEGQGNFYQIANNGLEAVEKCEYSQYDLIFMDVEMPQMGGLEATQRIRALEATRLTRRTPIIGLSGNARQEQIKQAKEAGMDDYLTKPFHKDEVYRCIETYSNRDYTPMEMPVQEPPVKSLTL